MSDNEEFVADLAWLVRHYTVTMDYYGPRDGESGYVIQAGLGLSHRGTTLEEALEGLIGGIVRGSSANTHQ